MKPNQRFDDFLKKAVKIHNNKYDYNLVEYKNCKIKVKIICPTHGVFEQMPDSHLQGKGCKKCRIELVGKINSTSQEQFIEKANRIHNFKYDYSKSIYCGDRCKMIIICPKHGEFLQAAGDHYNNKGCKKCGNENTSKYQKENPNGWNLSYWKEKALNSKNFDSFKIYIIRCWNDEEEFYKIGRTFLTINNRFKTNNLLPYNFEIVKEVIGKVDVVYKLEQKLKNYNKENKYTPKISFNGMHECFSKIKDYEINI